MLKKLESVFEGRRLNLPHRIPPLAHSPALVTLERLPARPHLPLMPHFPCPLRMPREVLVRLEQKTEKASRGGAFSPRDSADDIFFKPR